MFQSTTSNNKSQKNPFGSPSAYEEEQKASQPQKIFRTGFDGPAPIDFFSQVTQCQVAENEEELQMKEDEHEIQQKPNRTGLPDDLKAGVENLSGYSMDDVKVHHNSDMPAQVGALAYAQGADIHIAPGQEEHLPHEAWHIAQQKQGRVKPTKQMKDSVNVNDDKSLEKEADVMGAKAVQRKYNSSTVLQAKTTTGMIQMKTPAEKVKEFQSKTYSKTNFVPFTNLGLFDVNLNPVTGRLEIKVKASFVFNDGNAADFTGLKGQSEKWSDKDKKKWKEDFIKLLEGQWGGRYHFVNPELPAMQVFTDVEIEENNSSWHYQLSVSKQPVGGFAGSSISHYLDAAGKAKNTTNTHKGNLDSEDMTPVNKGASQKQRGAVHEFGHMIGLDDEYNDGTPGIQHAAKVQTALGKTLTEGTSNSIMSSGSTIGKEHYITFLDALRTITSDVKWTYKP